MAKDKKAFVLYADLIHTVSKLPDKEAGMLFKHILNYVNDENPQTDNIVIEIAFEPIKQQLKRDLEKWENIRVLRSKAGKASADKRQQMLTPVESVEQTPTNPTVSDTVNVNDTVKVKEIINNTIDFNIFWNLYPQKRKSEKKYCSDFWNNIKKEQQETIIKKLPEYIKSVTDEKYLKLTGYFFRNRKFEDNTFLFCESAKQIGNKLMTSREENDNFKD